MGHITKKILSITDDFMACLAFDMAIDVLADNLQDEAVIVNSQSQGLPIELFRPWTNRSGQF